MPDRHSIILDHCDAELIPPASEDCILDLLRECECPACLGCGSTGRVIDGALIGGPCKLCRGIGTVSTMAALRYGGFDG